MSKEKNGNIEANISKKRLIFLGSMGIVGAVLIVVYLAFTGNEQQIYKDIVNGYTAIDGSNKSAERILMYAFSALGSIVYLVYFLATQKLSDKRSFIQKSVKEYDCLLSPVLILSILLVIQYFVYSEVNSMLIAAVILALILCIVDKTLVAIGLIFLFNCVYAVSAIYRIYVFAGGKNSLNIITSIFISFIILSAILMQKKRDRKTLFVRGIMVLQLFIPFVLLMYLASKYKYGEKFVSLHIPYKVQVIIVLLICIFIMEGMLVIRKNWDCCGKGIGSVISSGACISIMAFNRYSGTGGIMSTDLHHPFEDIIGYSQIVELGQKPFSEYIPVSGMYSLVHGFFFSFFGEGKVAYYHLTTNLFFLTVIILIVFLLKKLLTGECVFFISLMFTVIDYNRVVFIVPIMLLLAWPQLIKKKNLWLKTWFLTSFLHGLYYPVYGAAVCIGYMPLGIWQIVSYIKSGDLKKDIKRFSFWMWWGICCIPVGLGIPLLLGTLKHMKAMGGQTVYADGTARFGQTVADNFVSYIQTLSLRLAIYYIFSFLTLISIVWVSVALCLKLANIRLVNRKMSISNPVPAFIALSVGITLLVSSSYTIIRLAVGNVYVRSVGVIYASFVMFVLLLNSYLSNDKIRYCVLAFAVFIMAAVSEEGFTLMDSNFKMDAYYTVPEDYVYVENSLVERLGTCFADRSIYNLIEYAYNDVRDIDRSESYLGIVSNFGLFYLCEFKGDSVIEIGTIKSYGAAQETVELIQQNDTIVGKNFNSIDHYYLYHWLVTSGKYIWSIEDRRFIPNDGDMTREEILLQNKNIDLALDGALLGRTASSWGLSIKELEDVFSDVYVEYTIEAGSDVHVNFNNSIDGDVVDFVYLEFAEMNQNYQYILIDHDNEDVIPNIEQNPYVKYLMKKDYNRGMLVTISWKDEYGDNHSMHCSMGAGRLLIPLGGGKGWLLNEHSNMMITVMQDGEKTIVPEINSLRFLKLREVE